MDPILAAIESAVRTIVGPACTACCAGRTRSRSHYALRCVL